MDVESGHWMRGEAIAGQKADLEGALRLGRAAAWLCVVTSFALMSGCGGEAARGAYVQGLSGSSTAPPTQAARVAPFGAASLGATGTAVHVDFEAGMADWSNWGNAQVSDGAGVSGSRGMVVGTAAGGAGLAVTGITPGTVYHFGAQARVTDAGETLFVGVQMLDAAGAQVGQQAASVTATSYTSVALDIAAPANATSAVLFVWKNAGAGDGQLDELTFGAGSPAQAPPPPGNLVGNGGFENGMGGWTDWGNATPVAGQGSSGSAALEVGPAAGGAGQTIGGVAPGSYRFTVNARVSVASETGYVGFNVLDAAGAVVASNSQTVSSTAYVPLALDVEVPAAGSSVQVYVWKNAGAGLALVDDFTLTPASAPTPPSASLLVNGDFENALSAWDDWGNAVAVAGAGSAGSAAVRVGTAAGGVGQSVGGIQPGRSYRLSAQARVDAGAQVAYVGLRFLDAAGTALSNQSAGFGTTAYAPVSLDVVAPANAAAALVYVWKDDGGEAYVDDVTLATGTAAAARGVFIGNSITYSVADPAMGWDHSGGMAASTAQADYVHRVSDALGLASPWVTNFAALEIDLNTALIPERTAAIDATTPVTVQLGDNVASGNVARFAQAYGQLLDSAQRGRSLVCVSTWWNRADVDALIQSACQSHGGTYVYIGDVRTDPANRDRLDGPQYADASVQSHPHDWSMDVIAQRVVAAQSR